MSALYWAPDEIKPAVQGELHISVTDRQAFQLYRRDY